MNNRQLKKLQENKVLSSKITTKYANVGKFNIIQNVHDEYEKALKFFIDILWNIPEVQSLISKETTDKYDSEKASRRLVQCAAKQASGIVRGTKKKNKERMYRYNELLKEGKTKQAKRLMKKIKDTEESKPEIKSFEMELDERVHNCSKCGLKLDRDYNASLNILRLGLESLPQRALPVVG